MIRFAIDCKPNLALIKSNHDETTAEKASLHTRSSSFEGINT